LEEIKRKKVTKMLELSQGKLQLNQECNSKPVTLTDACFSSEVEKHKVIVVDFWAPWCGPCRAVGPIIEQLASEYVGKVVFGKINVDENQIVPGQFGVQGIPTLMVFKNGEPVETIIGACPKAHIESKFRPYIDEIEKS
jgi:thioredoxin 1